MFMKDYVKPEIKVENLSIEDVITESPLSGMEIVGTFEQAQQYNGGVLTMLWAETGWGE